MGSRRYLSLIVVWVLVFGSFTAFFIPVTSSGTQEDLSSYRSSSMGMVSYWKLDENNGTTIKDSRGQNHGRTWGDPKRVEGKVGNALEFDGDEDFIKIADDPSLDTELNESFTLEFWLSREEQIGNDWDGIIEKSNDEDTWSYGVFFNSSGDGIRSAVQHHDDGSGTPAYTPSVSLTYDEWHHVAVSYSGSGITFYMDGENVSYTSYSGGVYDSPDELTIGRASWDGSIEYFKGKIDEIALYNKSLSATSIHNHYRKTRIGKDYLEEVVWVDDDYDSSTPGWQVDHFDSIQDGINAVNGSTVYVKNGTYNESVVVNKSIDLIGENRQNTTINGTGAERVVEISSDRVNMTGFTVKNGTRSGIYISGDHTDLRKNIVEYIIGQDGSGADNGDGGYGIYLTSVSNCTINDNIIRNIRGGNSGESGGNGGVAYGIFLNSVFNCTINDNNMIRDLKGGEGTNHGGDAFGIYIYDSQNNTLSSSSLGSINGGPGEIYSDGTGSGVFLYSSDHNRLIRSDLKRNDYAVRILDSSDNTFYHNNFVNSSIQHIFSSDDSPSNNTWTDGDGTGSYWDDYNGSDNGGSNRTPGDGIGDTLIPHPETDQGGGYYHLDDHPLTRPWPLKSLATAPWPMYGQDLKHTHRSPYNTSHVDGTVKWIYGDPGDTIFANPIIDDDGTIYFGSKDSNLYAVDPDGTTRWTANIGDEIRSTSALNQNGTLYFGCKDDNLYALNSNDGSTRWTRGLNGDVKSSPAIGEDGTIYVGSQQGSRVYAIDPDGSENWSTVDIGEIKTSPVIGENGTIYVGSKDSNVYAIYPNNGTIRWSFSTSNEFKYTEDPVIGAEGKIYAKNNDGNLYALYPNGSLNWSLTWGNISAGPGVGEDGNVYFGTGDGDFYAFAPNGTELWRYKNSSAENAITTSPAIGADGIIYFGTGGPRFYALNPDGTLRWNSGTLPGAINSDPSIGPDGRVYVGCDRAIYSFGASYGVNVTGPSDQIETVRNKTYTYDFTVENTGSANDTYTLNISDTNAAFLVSGPDQVTVSAGNSTTVTVEVKILENVTIGDSTAVTLNATSQKNATAMDEDVMNLIYENCGVNVTAPLDQVEAFQSTFTYKFWVNNTGSFDDTYDLNATSSNPNFIASCRDQVSVAEGAGKQVDVNVTITASASYGEDSTIALNATSQNSSASDISHAAEPIGSVSKMGEWNQGMFNSTSAERQDDSGDLGIGYRNGSAGDDLVGYYRMDRDISGSGGSVKDYSGEDNTGTSHNGVNTSMKGTFSTKCFEFDGTDDYVETSSGLINNGPFALSFWFKPDTSNWDGTLFDATNGNNSGGDSQYFYLHGDEDYLYWSYEDSPDDGYELNVTTDLTPDEWHHVVATGVFNGSGYQGLYVDGVQEGLQSVTAGDRPTIPYARIANYTYTYQWGGPPKSPFSGKIDEFQIYSKNITSKEVEELYHREGLVGFWKMDNSSVPGDGGTVKDHSAFAHDGETHNGINTSADGMFSTNSFEFNSSNDEYIEDGDAEDYINGQSSITVSAWIKSSSTGVDRGFIDGEDPAGDNNDNILSMRYDSSGTDEGGTNLIKCGLSIDGSEYNIESSSNVQTTEWQHLVFTWKSGEGLELYINGQKDDLTSEEGNNVVGSITGATGLWIGGGPKGYWDGRVDEVRLYNRTLSEEEMKDLYSQSKHAGTYQSQTFNVPENEAPYKIRVNSTNIDSENETWVNVSTSRGGYDLIKLDEGMNDKNYSLDIPQTGGSANVTFTLTSGQPATTPVIGDFTLYSAPRYSDEDSMVVSYENYSVDVGPPSDQQETGTGTYNYTFMVNNTGTYEDNYTLSASSSNSGPFQIVEYPNWVFVSVGGSVEVNVTVDIQGPISARDSSSISLNATSMNYPSIYDNDSMRVTYGQYNVSVKAPQDQLVTDTGTHSFLFEVNNTGSLNETFDLTVGTSESWSAYADPDPVHVLWNESKSVYVNVTVPSTATGNTTCRVTLNASSVNGNATGEDFTNITYHEATVDVVPPGERIEFQPGSYLYQFRINNNGTIDDTYDLSVFSSNTAWSVSLLNSSVTIPANGNKTVTVTVTIPTTANPGDYSLISLNSTSQNWSAYDNDTMKVSYDEYGVNVTAPEDMMKTQTKIYSFKFWVNNTGTLNDTYTLNAISDNPDFTISSYPNMVQVDANRTRKVYINVTISSAVNPGDTANITLKATSNNESGISDQDSLMILYEEYNVGVQAPSDTTKTGPGTYTFQFWINNTGSLNNTFALNVICTNPNWTFTLNSTIWVGAHEREPVDVTVDIPESSPGGITETITLNATGKNGTAVYDEDSMDLTYEKYDLNVAGPSAEVMFIENKTFQFSIENTGSLSDTYTMTVSSSDLDWDVTIENNSTVTLSPGDTAKIPVEVKAPSSVRGGNFTNVILNGTSDGSETSGLHSMKVTYEDLNVTVNAPSDAEVFTRDNHTYRFRINNTGSLEDTYELDVTTNNSWDVSVVGLNVTVPADQGREVTVNITVPADAQLGESSRITLEAISQKRAFSRSKDSFVVSYEGYGVEVNAPSGREENSSGTYNYTFTVENTGTVVDTYGLTAVSNNSDFAVSVVEQISLAPKNSREVYVKVTISSDATSGESALIELEVTSENSAESSIDSLTVSYVEEKDDISPTSRVDPLPTYNSNESFQVHFETSDDNALRKIELYYRLEQEGWKYWETVDISGTSADASFTFTAAEDGNYSFYTIATDAAGNSESPPEEADASVIVDPTAPEVSIIEPAEGSLMNTSDVEVTWIGSDNTSGLSYYEIKKDDGTWKDNGLEDRSLLLELADGVHLVEVRAVDKAGNKKIIEVQFEIDTAPPMLSIKSPDEDESFEEASVLIDWEGEDNQTRVVSYRLRLNGKSWIDPGAEESYTFSNLSDGSYTVEVRCTDEAGNTRAKEVDFEVATSGGGDGTDEDTTFLQDSCWLWLILIILMAVFLALVLFGWRRRREEEPEEVKEKRQLEKEEEDLPSEQLVMEKGSEEPGISGGEEVAEGAPEEVPAEPEMGEPEVSEEGAVATGVGATAAEKEEKEGEEGEEGPDLDKLDVVEDFQKLKGLGSGVAHALYEAGYHSMDELEEAEVEDIKAIGGIGITQAELIYEAIQRGEEEEEKGKKAPHISEEDLEAHQMGPMVKGREMKKGQDKKKKPSHLEESDMEPHQVDSKQFEGETGEEVEEEAREMEEPEMPPKEDVVEEFKQFKGVGSAMASRLYESGFHSLEEIKETSPEELQEVKGIGPAKSEKLYESIQDVES
ncbi:MAG: PQQ-binding-like beta-propeller repeat protein [Candidatus Thermoplasmatota archaeon]|nr:PQQ-binding-like beta-propeller repeat protein [Candidatus Thermoplasmatota archaeon]